MVCADLIGENRMKDKGFITVALASLMAISMAAGVWAQDKHMEAK
jgi:hypothetical protein